LVLYALIGFVLPLFRKCSDRTLLIWAIALIASPLIIDTISVMLHINIGDFLEKVAVGIDKKTGIPTDSTYSAYLFKENSGWNEWRNWQASGWAYRYSDIIGTNRIPKVLGMFLLGFYAGRKMIYINLDQYERLFRLLRKWGFIIGIPCSIALAIFEIDEKGIPDPMGLLETFFYAISVVPMSLAYVAALCLTWIKTKGNSKWRILAPVGRMALTNYLMQTILGILIFYGLGLGLGGNIGPVLCFPIAIGIYILQIIYSNWWFKYFQYGPLEWVWRQLTYGKRLSLKRDRIKL